MDIQAEQLRITLGDSEILKGVDFAAQGKQLVGIIGSKRFGKKHTAEVPVSCAQTKCGIGTVGWEKVGAMVSA